MEEYVQTEIGKTSWREVEDGRQDLFVTVNGVRAITMHQEFLNQNNIEYEKAKKAMKTLSSLILYALTSMHRAEQQ